MAVQGRYSNAIPRTVDWDPRISEYHPRMIGTVDPDAALKNEIDYYVKECRDGLPIKDKHGKVAGWRHTIIPVPPDVARARASLANKIAFPDGFGAVIGEYDTVDEAVEKLKAAYLPAEYRQEHGSTWDRQEHGSTWEVENDDFRFIEDDA